MYRYAVRVTGNWATAEDVVSLTFLEAWRLRDKVHAEGESLCPWLLGIATNVMRNTVRSARRHDLALARLPEPEAEPDFADGVAARLADTEELAAAQVALGGLRRAEREVFTLCVWEGLDHAAAAEALGVAVGTVRSRLSRARGRLRKLTEAELRSRGKNGRVGSGGGGSGNDVERNCAERNGAERNGAERNGAERNGAERNGAERNGAERNGVERDGRGESGRENTQRSSSRGQLVGSRSSAATSVLEGNR
ncbi:sigma-70 family RNA polymerase sigma factor [Streptomyces sp. NPDC102274]|uniref:RNA polymerase sigma factor n=1 Tax=Streptomyces sp. NPDC102274 TaxID=3366151 RepID=UPI00381C18CF